MRAFDPLSKLRAIELVAQDNRVSDASFRLFSLFMSFENSRNGLCCPSQETLASIMGHSIRSVRRHQKLLENSGYISVSYGSGRSGTNQYNLYRPTGKEEWQERKNQLKLLRKQPSDKPNTKPIDNLSTQECGVSPVPSSIEPEEISSPQKRLQWLSDQIYLKLKGNELAMKRLFDDEALQVFKDVEFGDLPPKVGLHKLLSIALGGGSKA